MPRVPTSDNVVPMQQADIPGVTPSPTMFAMAAAMMHSEGRLINNNEEFKVAGDVVPFKGTDSQSKDWDKIQDRILKIQTRDSLSRALGGRENIRPLTPGGDGK